ncbi:MAG: HNH endonuclease [Gammaproteobacteria bacterium]|nr:HNH endonuclease [Gammaproteobacteria bacterium]
MQERGQRGRYLGHQLSVEVLLESRSIPEPNSGCTLWLGTLTNALGYGRLLYRGVAYMAHRLAWETFVGAIPEGMHLDHLCRNPSCINVAHLEPVTQRENVLRGRSLQALNAKKKECPRGHSFSASNTYVDKQGRRTCRTCNNATARLRKQRFRTRQKALASRD